MRTSAARLAMRAANSLAADTLATTAIPAPIYICASCRLSSLPSSFSLRHSNSHHRHVRQRASPFSTSQRRLQQPKKQASHIDSTSPQASQTYYDLFPSTFPDGPPPKSPFGPDLRALRAEFLQLQAAAHPDRASPSNKRRAEALSARINEAYRTLADPLRRVTYLLSLRGVDVEDESGQVEDQGLLVEVMEARERVDEVEDEEGLESLKAENGERMEACVGELEGAIERGDWDVVKSEAVRLRFWSSVGESIAGWEKGSGGGILHH